MENSCRKNLKQSSKKWVVASVYPKFRRNLCLRSTNADLYHYAGNNPVRYIDPDGRYPYSKETADFIKEVFGSKGTRALENVSYKVILNNYDACSLTFLWNTERVIFLNIPCYENPMATNSTRNDFAHEVFHQIQYTNQIDPDINIDFYDASPFSVLGIEKISGIISNIFNLDIDVYDYGDLSQYNKLSDFINYEAQAQMAGDFADLYYQARYVGIDLSLDKKRQLKESVRIFENSGMVTEATKWIKENF